MLDGDLVPADGVIGETRARPGHRPPAPGLEERDRDALLVAGEVAGDGLEREAHGGAAQIRHGGEVRAERARRQAELHGAESVLGVDHERAEGGQALPEPVALRGGRAGGGVRADPLAREQRVDRLAEPGLLVGELEVHVYSWGRARMRSAMMLRWICCVPPYTVAARE